MTKATELQLLRELAAKLNEGPSYTGALIAHLIPMIEQDLKSDFIPEFDLRGAQAACRAEREACAAACAKERQQARELVEAELERVEQEKRRAQRIAQIVGRVQNQISGLLQSADSVVRDF